MGRTYNLLKREWCPRAHTYDILLSPDIYEFVIPKMYKILDPLKCNGLLARTLICNIMTSNSNMYFYGNGPMGQLSNEFKAGRPSFFFFFLFPSTKVQKDLFHFSSGDLIGKFSGCPISQLSRTNFQSYRHVLCFKMCNNIKIPVPIIELQNQFETIIPIIITIFYLQIKSLPMLETLWKLKNR